MCRKFLIIALISIALITGAAPSVATAVNPETVYQWNLSVYNSKSTAEATLAYYRLPEILIDSDDENIISLALSVTEEKSGDYEKAHAIHDWVAENIWYDINGTITGATHVLETRRSVCNGYANLTAAMLKAVGIPAKVVTGFALGVSGTLSDFKNTSGTVANHAWNEAYADGRWIIIDTTWDSNNRYENGAKSSKTVCKQDYFDISLKDISKDHRYLDYTDYYSIDGLIIDCNTDEVFDIHESFRDVVTEAVIPDGTKSIGAYAFQYCGNLKSVIIPQSVTSIDSYAFSICPNLKSIIIPNSVTEIGTNVFWRSPDVVIYGNAGSYAEDYATEQSLPFVDGLPVDDIDKPSVWAKQEVNAAISVGLVPQSLQSKYAQTITRAEYCALAVMFFEKYTGAEITGRKSFSDSNDINVEKMAAVGIVSGIGNDLFDPDAELTREQAATMLSRLADAVGKPLPRHNTTFIDKPAISSWAAESVGQVQSAEIMGGVGDNTFAPKDPYTREQSIITMIRLLNVI